MRYFKIILLFSAITFIISACSSSDRIPTGPPEFSDDEYPFYGVSGLCLVPPGWGLNGVVCYVVEYDNSQQWFNVGVSTTHPIHGSGWYECATTESGPFPDDGTLLVVVGYYLDEPWGASEPFEWEYPNVTNVTVWEY